MRESAKTDIQGETDARIEAGTVIEELPDGREDVMTTIDTIEGIGTPIEMPSTIEIVVVEGTGMGLEVEPRIEKEVRVRRRRKRSQPRI